MHPSDKQREEDSFFVTAMKHNPIAKFLLVMAVSSALAACALIGGGPGIERATGYHLDVPAQWQQTRRAESDRAYRLPSGNIATVTSSCNRNPDAPLDVLTRHLLIGTRDVKVHERKKSRFGANEGLHSSVTTKLEGKTFHLELFVLTRSGCVFDFSLVSPRPIPAKDSTAFQALIASFRHGKD